MAGLNVITHEPTPLVPASVLSLSVHAVCSTCGNSVENSCVDHAWIVILKGSLCCCATGCYVACNLSTFAAIPTGVDPGVSSGGVTAIEGTPNTCGTGGPPHSLTCICEGVMAAGAAMASASAPSSANSSADTSHGVTDLRTCHERLECSCSCGSLGDCLE